MSVDAATKDSLKAIDRPLFADFWERYVVSTPLPDLFFFPFLCHTISGLKCTLCVVFFFNSECFYSHLVIPDHAFIQNCTKQRTKGEVSQIGSSTLTGSVISNVPNENYQT